jgi:class 3 adenylate cyclase
VLATILCTAIGGAEPADVASEIDRVHALVSAEAQVFNGRSVEHSGGRVFAAFDGPARAIRCGRRIADEAARLGVTLGLGLHTGECDRLRGAGEGPVAEAAQRIAALARPGEVLVSRTVVDLVAGSKLQFSDRGRHALVSGEKARPLFAVR